ncbi:MAG: hypothetical protein KDC27_12690, partial [Acidobacteria bacterium]|nr:hypothetical protein [Acidobacteriota bacterium]
VEKSNGTTVSFAGLIRARNIETEALPAYATVDFTTRFPAEQWTALRANPQSYLQLYQAFKLTPGRYQWDLAMHDRVSGKMSVYRTQVDVPDLSGPSTVGPLYLSVLRGGPHPRLVTLLANRTSEAPPDDVYLKGDRIAAQLALYQPTEEEFAAAERGNARLQVFRAEEQRPEIDCELGASSNPNIQRIHFRGIAATENLAPGAYRVVAVLPGGRQVERAITITE